MFKIDQNGKITLSKKELSGKLNSWDLQIPLLQSQRKMKQASEFNKGSSFFNPYQNSHYIQDVKKADQQAKHLISENRVNSHKMRRARYSVESPVKQFRDAYIKRWFFDIYHKIYFLQIFILNQNGDEFFVPIQQDPIRQINVNKTYAQLIYLIDKNKAQNTINVSSQGVLTIKYQQSFTDYMQDRDQIFKGIKVQCDQNQQLEKLLYINKKTTQLKLNQLQQQIQHIQILCQAQIIQLKRQSEIRHLGLISPQLFTYQIPISSILSTVQECQTLFGFFTQKIKHLRLLYKGSQNGFSSQRFHFKCDYIPSTLVIAQTQYKNIIGGYAHPPWNKQIANYTADPTKRSFLFSLTNKDKFQLKDANVNYSIYSNIAYGPTFGSGHDLSISNKCNASQNSYANICSAYGNLKYINGNAESQKLFSGSRNFKVLEYEVYEVVFVE